MRRRIFSLLLALFLFVLALTPLASIEAMLPSDTPPFGAGKVGAIGCSNTSQHLEGYATQSSLDQLTNPNLGSLSFEIWGNPTHNKYANAWGKYDSSRPVDGYSAAWVMPCVKDKDGFDSELLMTEVVEEIRERDPLIPIFVSPLNPYEEGHVCNRVGARGVDVSQAVVDWSADNLGTQYGPVTGPLTIDLIGSDGCHLNQNGINLVGSQLVEWFDNGGWQNGPFPQPDQTPDPLPTLTQSAFAGPIGVVGCSNTIDHIAGYETVSDLDKFWNSSTLDTFNGMNLDNWGTGSGTAWTQFENNVAAKPPSLIWLQICINSDEDSALPSTLEQQVDLLYTFNRINETLPNTPVVVSPINSFSLNDCSTTGIYGYGNAQSLADWLAAENRAYRGPNTGPLDHSQLLTDFCRLNDSGKSFVGNQLVDFFETNTPIDPTYWCVDGVVVEITDGSSPSGTYVAGPYSNNTDASNDPGCAIPDLEAPTVPVDLTAVEIDSDSVELSWQASTDNIGVTNYILERDGAEVAQTPNTSLNSNSLSPLTTYSFVVYAEDAAGNRSPASSTLMITTTEAPDTIAPTSPTNLTSEVVSESEVDLSWGPSTDNEGVSQYVINRNGQFLASTTDLSYADTTVVPGPTYTYTVQAEDLSGNQSDPSNPAEATIEDLEAPTAPANLATTSLSHNQISLTWDASSDNGVVAKYVIERDGVEIGEATNISYTDSTVNELTTYSYVVYAEDAAGNRSVASSPLIVVTPEAPDTTPPTVALTSPAASSTVSGTVNVSADASDNEQVTSVEIRLDGTPVATLTNLPYEYSWDTTLVAEGSHTLTAIATDSSGNSTTSSSVTVVVDNLPDSQFTASSYMVNAGDTVTFYDSLASGQKRRFFFGDGTKTVTTFSSATKTYLVPGTYNASLETISLQTGLRTTFNLTIVVL